MTEYSLAEPNTRRLFNQAIFARIWIDREQIAQTELAGPFSELLDENHDEARSQPVDRTQGTVVRPMRRGVDATGQTGPVPEQPDLAGWTFKAGEPRHSGSGHERNLRLFARVGVRT